jgi:hypothetical protein
MDLQEIRRDFIELDSPGFWDQWRYLLNTVMSLRIP